MAAMSVSSFHRHFRVVTSMNPIHYQKQIRWRPARGTFAQSADVAAVGYTSPLQFSREYSRVHGALPRRDAARVRRPTLEPSQGYRTSFGSSYVAHPDVGLEALLGRCRVRKLMQRWPCEHSLHPIFCLATSDVTTETNWPFCDRSLASFQ